MTPPLNDENGGEPRALLDVLLVSVLAQLLARRVPVLAGLWSSSLTTESKERTLELYSKSGANVNSLPLLEEPRMEGFEIGVAHQQLCDRLSEMERQTEERRLSDALLLERIQVLESNSHHHSEEPEEQEEEHQEEVQEEREEIAEETEPEVVTEPEEPAEEPIAEVPPERKHLLHRVIWSR